MNSLKDFYFFFYYLHQHITEVLKTLDSCTKNWISLLFERRHCLRESKHTIKKCFGKLYQIIVVLTRFIEQSIVILNI